jgi:MFS family permease
MAQVSTNVALAGSVRLERQGVAFGAKQAAVPLAGLVAGLAVPVIALVAGWRAAFFGAAAISAGALLYAPGLGRPGTRAPAARPRPTRLLVLMGIFGLLGGAVGNSLPAFAVDSAVTRGIGEGAAGLILALGSATAVVGRIGAGLVVDRRGSAGYTELLALTVAGSLALAVLAASGGSDALFVVAIVASFGCAWSWQGLIYYAAVRSHPSAPGAATAVVLSSVYAGNVIGPVVVGLVAEHRSYDAAWGLAAVVLVLATPAGIAARRLHRRQGPGQPR